METIKVLVGWSGKNYSACTGEINGVVVTTHKTLEGVKKEFKEAFAFHIEGSLEDGDPIADYIRQGHYEFDFKLQISALLHLLDGVLTRAALARATGINQRQLGHYIQGEKEPRPQTQEKIIKGIKKIGEQLMSVV